MAEMEIEPQHPQKQNIYRFLPFISLFSLLKTISEEGPPMTKVFLYKFWDDYNYSVMIIPSCLVSHHKEAELRIIFPQSFKGGKWSQGKKWAPAQQITQNVLFNIKLLFTI